MKVSYSLLLLCGSFAASLALVPAAVRLAWRIGAVDRGGYRKMSKGAIPLLGGLAVGLPLLFVSLLSGIAGFLIVGNWKWLWLNYRDWFDTLFDLASNRSECLTFAVGGAAILLLGLIDDAKGLRARHKLLGQVAVAVFLCFSGFLLTAISIPFYGPLEFGVGVGALVTVLWVVGMINAFNLIDGIDGLAAGMGLIGAGALVVLSLIEQDFVLASAGLALTGALLAFLPFNFPPAKMFLGDTGSMFIGYALACIALLGAQKTETAVIVLAPMLALSFPVFETLVSILRRYLRGVPVFAGDNFHTHHRLLRKGYSEPRVVLTLYLVGVILAVAAVLSALIPESSRWYWLPYALYVGTLLYVARLADYFRMTTLRNVLARRDRNKRMQSLAKYGRLCLKDGIPAAKMNVLLEMCRLELGLKALVVKTRGGKPFSSPKDLDPNAAPLSEQLLVKSADGQDVLIQYAHLTKPGNDMRHDVTTCLAGVFDGLLVPARDTTHPGIRVDSDQVLEGKSGSA